MEKLDSIRKGQIWLTVFRTRRWRNSNHLVQKLSDNTGLETNQFSKARGRRHQKAFGGSAGISQNARCIQQGGRFSLLVFYRM